MINYRQYYVGDFETTVYTGQTDTEVWASAIVKLETEDVYIFTSIEDTFEYIQNLKHNCIVYYHNLKFDGCFWLNYLIDIGFKQALLGDPNDYSTYRFMEDDDMPPNTFKYIISDMGQWYKIIIHTENQYIELRDSMKLLPFSVERIGESFKTKHRKLDIEYYGERHAHGVITDEERAYIANDALVVKEALEIMFSENHKKLTIGSCCFAEYKQTLGKEYKILHPNLYDIELDPSYGSPNAGEYIRKSYRGGWCYLVPEKAKQVLHNGTTADVNSLYSSVMSSESGNYYPAGKPTFWKGNFIPDFCFNKELYYFFVRIQTRFYVKPDKLPFVNIKGSPYYPKNQSLTTSDVLNKKTGKYQDYFIDKSLEKKPAIVTLTLTQTDYQLLKEHYDLVDFQILDGCYFTSCIGLFDAYMYKYKKIKMESKGARRELAKLFLNNLYGKTATNTKSSFKVCHKKEDGSLGFTIIEAYDKMPGYIAIGSAITSYARNFTIRAAQINYHGANQRGFVYADTDSIHCDLEPQEIKGITVHPTNFCCWKLESQWDDGYFVRAKTYIEHITHEDEKPIETPYYNVKCAGMPEKSKDLFIASMTQNYNSDELTAEELDFVRTKRELTDFDIGLCVPGKLVPKQIKGGVILCETSYEMRENLFGII